MDGWLMTVIRLDWPCVRLLIRVTSSVLEICPHRNWALDYKGDVSGNF